VPLARIYLLQGQPAKLIDTVPADALPPAVRLEVLTLRGSAYAALDKTAEAERSFFDARTLDPASPLPLVAEVPVLIASGRIDLARERAASAVQLGPQDAGAFNARAAVAHASGELASALNDYERAIALQPGLIDARVARAGLLIDLGREADARADLDDLASTGPIDPRVAYLRALLASRRGDAAAAARHLEEVARLVDALPLAWIEGQESLLMAGALVHHAGRQYEKAGQYLKVLVARYPRNVGARKLLAAVYVDTADHPRATALLEQVLREQPDDPQALYLLGRVYLAQQRYAKATELLERAAVRGGSDARLHASLGFSRLGTGDLAAGLIELQAAFERTPTDLGLAITLANAHMHQGNARQALDVAQRASAALPGNPAGLNLLGVVRGADGDLAGAAAAYREALQHDAGFTPAQLNLARLEAAQGRLDQARTIHAALLKKNRRDATTMYEAGLLEQGAGRTAEALRWFEKAVAERPTEVRFGLALIETKAATGDRAGALEAARTLAARRHDDLSALAALAQIHIDSGDAAGARQTLRDMTRQAEFDTRTLVRIGYLQLAATNPDGARYAAQKALQGTPDDLSALVLAAEAALAAKEIDQADQRVGEIRSRHPAMAEGLRLAGDVALARRQYAAAGEAYRQAADRQPSTALTLRRVGVLVAQRNPAAGLPLLQTWLAAHPDDVAVRKALAELHMMLGDWQAARREYESLVGRGLHDAVVLNNLANTLLALNDITAVTVARQAVALDPRSANALDTLGWALARSGQTEEAMAVLREARLRDPESIEIRFHLAHVLQAKARTEEAKEELRAAIARMDRKEITGEQRQLLDELAL
jgi:putative PEP-CTERM system TPR-repeat lipoprotein